MSQPTTNSQNATKAELSTGNPAFRMLGLPRLRAKLPSRNWMIFWTVVGSFTGAVFYDRRQKRNAQQHWCTAVSRLSREPLEPNQLPRKLTIFLSAPPGDGLRPSREFFIEYVKPILVAAAMDWEVVEGRKEGEVRAALAERIRKARIKGSEMPTAPKEDGEQDVIQEMRERLGVHFPDSRGGDLVIGRHTWKEYVRGLHEGWLGPLDEPAEQQENNHSTLSLEPLATASEVESSYHTSEPPQQDSTASMDAFVPNSDESDSSELSSQAADSASSSESSPPEQTPQSKDATSNAQQTPSKESPLQPYIFPASYHNAAVAPSIPSSFNSSTAISHPHLLGFFNSPIRIYRFLTRHQLADATGRQVASFLLADETRQYRSPMTESTMSYTSDRPRSELSSIERDISADELWEAQSLLAHEQQDWHKSAREPNKEGHETKERPWQEPMTLDSRIAERMRTPETESAVLPEANATAEQKEEGNNVQTESTGNYREWQGGADPILRHISWGQWLKEVTGFDDPREPRGLGEKDGWVDSE